MCVTNQTIRRALGWTLVPLLACTVLRGEPVTNELASTSFDDLLVHIQRYGSTEAKREKKRRAKKEFIRREDASLIYLMDHIEIENMWIVIMADTLCRELPKEKAVPVLVRYLEAPHDTTRKFAAYWLGFYTAPEHGAVLRPLLANETTAGSAMRTLGKWQITSAVSGIHPYLAHKKERLRIRAVNALRDIGCDESIPGLIIATDDPIFTVRKAAARALATYGKTAQKQVVAALTDAEPPAHRELISVLGSMRTRTSTRILRRLLKSPDPLIRESAARALLDAAPVKSEPWLKKAGIPVSELTLLK